MLGMGGFCVLVPDVKIFMYHLCLLLISIDISERIVKTLACGKIYKSWIVLLEKLTFTYEIITYLIRSFINS
jgi:hypothetical protein